MAEGVNSPRPGNAVVLWLARLRVSLGFGFGMLVLWLAHPTVATLAAGIPVAVIGELLRVWASGHLNKSREVTSSGPYRWFAHPLYVGSSVMGVGLAIASGRAVVAALVVVYLAVTLTAAIKSEEAFLRGRFGDQYDRYRHGGAPSANDAGRRFAVSQAIANREYRAIAGLIGAVLLLILKATYNGLFWRAAGTEVVRPGG
jgi:protein-S-isoprenylcysteine O-methyltransferase Ste14